MPFFWGMHSFINYAYIFVASDRSRSAQIFEIAVFLLGAQNWFTLTISITKFLNLGQKVGHWQNARTF